MSIAKYYVGQIVYFEYEYLIAELLSTGHTERTEYVDLSGCIVESIKHNDGWEYLIDLIDAPEEIIDYEITIAEEEILDVEHNEVLLNNHISALTQM